MRTHSSAFATAMTFAHLGSHSVAGTRLVFTLGPATACDVVYALQENIHIVAARYRGVADLNTQVI